MLVMGVMEPARTGWAVPIVFMWMKNCILRFCVDYQILKRMSIQGSHTRYRAWTNVSIPRARLRHSRLRRKWRILTGLNHRAKRWRNEIHIPSRLVLVYTNAIWAENASETLQRAMDIVLMNEKWRFPLVLLEDIIIVFQKLDQHIEHVI